MGDMVTDAKVLVIGIDCEEELTAFREHQTYKNIECISLKCDLDFFDRVLDYMGSSRCRYVTFLEKGQKAKPEKIQLLLQTLQSNKKISAVLCTSNIMNEGEEIIAHPDYAAIMGIGNQLWPGKAILQYCLRAETNLVGTLSNIMAKSRCIRQLIPLKPQYKPIMPTAILYNIILNCNVMVLAEPLIDRIMGACDKEQIQEKKKAFAEFISDGIGKAFQADKTHWENCGLPACYSDDYGMEREDIKLERKMTFYYTDKGEFYNFEPLMTEANKRGYEVVTTDHLDEKSEIGFFCQHFPKPQNARFSIALLHDMAQGHNRWPNLWEVERWNLFDIGILPGNSWKTRWEECAGQHYANPRKGVFALGYPKSDYVNSEGILSRAKELKSELKVKYDKTILYAPSWENDGKEDDFVCALASMKANLLIKQASYPAQYEQIKKNIQEMRKMHEGIYENVYYVEPEESILVALAMSDMIVSDESSVMTEALLFGIPSIAVTDWLIPDTVPSRLASVPMEYVFRCKKAQLRKCAEAILGEERYRQRVLQYRDENFTNIGICCQEILDCVEYYVSGGTEQNFQKNRLEPKNMPFCLWY